MSAGLGNVSFEASKRNCTLRRSSGWTGLGRFKRVDVVMPRIRVPGLRKSSEVMSARLSKERVRLIEEIARAEKVDKSTVIDRALERYATEWKLERAVESYRDGSVTLVRAAEIAGISIWEMMDVLGRRKVQAQYDLEDFEEDLKTLGRD